MEDDAINATIDKEKTEINKPSVKKLSTDERRERGLKYISKMTTKYQKDIDKFLLGVTVLEIEELTNEQVSELANNIKKLEREGA